ncbi:carboxylesterase/lipase family protein [Clostridium sp. HBUAS56017]|uniref:carboxylesterase/lipase family protein n=1 Tax=Clostridium sp. HBUAS56017 TaxID=2571128 RepID=UPI001178830A|nr:carboxylesterase/lipase family protein [Clostridium sp. HBUAS56017]
MSIKVNTKYGVVKGMVKKQVSCFLGIPYAKAPIGELRFKSPQPPESWSGVRDATKFEKNPIQVSKEKNFNNLSEDCLYLNIWVPDTDNNNPLPVMMWIHGGSYAKGGGGRQDSLGAESIYDGEILARDTGCIIVSISYRLNVFGFLNLSNFDSYFEDNLGLKDQLAALKWIHSTISDFGGDLENVTIFGQSAGGASVLALLVIPEASPYFHKAIVQSSCIESFYTPEEGEEIASEFLKLAGIDKNHIKDLLNLEYSELMDAAIKLDDYVHTNYFGRCTFCPVVDLDFLPVLPSKAEFKNIGKPLLVGTNHDEANLFSRFFKESALKKPTITDGLLHKVDEVRREELFKKYKKYPSIKAFAEITTDVMYTIPEIRLVEKYCKHNDVYVYRMDYYSLILRFLGLKACHAVEVPMLFGNLAAFKVPVYFGSSKNAAALGLRMRRYWGEFAHTGVPTLNGMKKWDKYDLNTRMTMIFNKNDSLISDPDKIKREMYKDINTLLI